MLSYIKGLFKSKGPIYLPFEVIIPFDCDDTLVMWVDKFDKSDLTEFKCPYTGEAIFLKPHQKHISLLKKYKKRGFGVKVWSHGGAPWAREVVRVLKLEPYVDIIEAKPDRYVDDLHCKEFMGQRVYIKDDK
jgi:hypothetical protein